MKMKKIWRILARMDDNAMYKGLAIFYTTFSYGLWAFSSGVDNYFSYVHLKRSMDSSAADILETLAKPDDGRNSQDKRSEWDKWLKERDSMAADLKKFKWTARFVRMFPPES